MKGIIIWILTRTRFFDYIIMRLSGDFYKEVLSSRICRALGHSKVHWREMAEAFKTLSSVADQCNVTLEELEAAIIATTEELEAAIIATTEVNILTKDNID